MADENASHMQAMLADAIVDWGKTPMTLDRIKDSTLKAQIRNAIGSSLDNATILHHSARPVGLHLASDKIVILIEFFTVLVNGVSPNTFRERYYMVRVNFIDVRGGSLGSDSAILNMAMLGMSDSVQIIADSPNALARDFLSTSFRSMIALALRSNKESHVLNILREKYDDYLERYRDMFTWHSL